ncbi:hypothetical protein R0L47_21790 [Pectobacterium polonicum]|uniref:hypothetical protein n=1 Tax=Pectobacterium TaxID=122277 RepID=UPI0013FD671F|nr:hypothetical protein [Pectobacterium punjabense]MBS4432796.1 hypothetical protein [Pectobacterium punjabense]
MSPVNNLLDCFNFKLFGITLTAHGHLSFYRDNHHKNKAIFYGGFRGGAVYDKNQKNR